MGQVVLFGLALIAWGFLLFLVVQLIALFVEAFRMWREL